MTIAQLFLNLASHKGLPINFSESLESLYSLEFEDSGLVIRDVLNARYPDGITGLEDVEVDGDTILGVFLDQVSPTVTKKFNFSINTTTGDVEWEQTDTGDLGFVEVDFAVKKSQNCKEGKSSACTRDDGSIYCIALGKKCRPSKLKTDEQKKLKGVVTKAPKNKTTKKTTTKTKKTEGTSKPHVDKKKTSKQDKPSSTQTAPNSNNFQYVKNDWQELSKSSRDFMKGYSSELRKKSLNPDILDNLETGQSLFRIIQKKIKDFAEIENSDYPDNLKEQVLSGKNITGVRDNSGNLQAVIDYSIVDTGVNKFIKVDYLVTAPWNITGRSSKSVRGAGTEAIINAITDGLEKGSSGEVRLIAASKAVPFYEKLGFKKQDDADVVSPMMVLSSEDAKALLKKLGR